MSIALLKHNEIDARRWDNCIYRSLNGSIYGFSWYLDIFGSDWQALVEDNYVSVMPLITARVMGESLIFNPVAARDLGIFSRVPVTAAKTEEFLSSIPSEYKWYQVTLNKFNPVKTLNKGSGREGDGEVHNSARRRNIDSEKRFSLDLISPYYKISRNFTPSLQNLLHRAVAQQPEVKKGISVNEVIGFIKKHGIQVDKCYLKDDFRVLRAVMAGLIRTNSGDLYGVYGKDRRLASAGIVAWLVNRVFLLFLASDPGEGLLAPHLFLIDRIIDKYSETNSILNFDYLSPQITPGIYRSFGATESAVTRVTGGSIPFFYKWFL